jgi:hypothetical protein
MAKTDQDDEGSGRLDMQRKSYDIQGISILGSDWHVEELIPDEFQLPDVEPTVRSRFITLLERDVFSEGDSVPLYEHLLERSAEFCPEFMVMMEFWLQDELRHYQALRMVYHRISGVSLNAIDLQNQARVHELEPIAFLLENEFTLLVGLMFDELGSVWSYRRDITEFYQHYGTGFARVGHWIMQDEGRHFGNAVTLIKSRHADKIPQIRSLLQKISQVEADLSYYPNTFFFDHAQERHRFPKDFSEQVIRRILTRFQ